jgi:hypothetical protein
MVKTLKKAISPVNYRDLDEDDDQDDDDHADRRADDIDSSDHAED